MATGYARSLEQTPTWAVAVVCFVLVFISILIEYVIHFTGKWLKKKRKLSLYEALQKIKAELMLVGFISLMLTVGRVPISKICIPKSIGDTWHPCKNKKQEKDMNTKYKLQLAGENTRRGHLNNYDLYSSSTRRILAAGSDHCSPQGKVPLVSAYGIHQLHIFIFVLAIVHVIYSILTLTLARAKMRRWKAWERETTTIEYEYTHDPERFRFARNTSFGRRHLSSWSKSPVLLWVVCFFRQFFRSVLKIDYMTLRHGFIMAHLAPQGTSKFDFQKYIKRSLEDDFKVIVGISPVIWFFGILFLMANTHGWYSYLWLPFIPLIIILLVGVKLQVIITKMGLSIQDKGEVIRGVPIVKPTDELFWFNSPRFMLSLIHFALFQNAFQLAFFVWTTYEFGLKSCYHEHVPDISIRISMGVFVQFLCSYVTLPLYALVTQMGTTMKPTIFNERVARALKNWHHIAKEHVKHGGQLVSITPTSSMPSTPTRMGSSTSPIHLLHNKQAEPGSGDHYHWYNEGSSSPSLSSSPSGFKHENHEIVSMDIQSPPSQ